MPMQYGVFRELAPEIVPSDVRPWRRSSGELWDYNGWKPLIWDAGGFMCLSPTFRPVEAMVFIFTDQDRKPVIEFSSEHGEKATLRDGNLHQLVTAAYALWGDVSGIPFKRPLFQEGV